VSNLQFGLVEAMERRKSLVYCGATEEDIEALQPLDETFYGFADPECDDESSDSEGSDDDSRAKRLDYGADDSCASSDEYFSGEEDLTATGGGSPLRGEAADEVTRAFLYSKFRDNKKSGCSCVTNHWTALPVDAVETLMVNIAAMSKSSKKQ